MNLREGKIKVKNMATLRQEKLRLKQLCRELEGRLDQRFDYLKENYRTMAFNTVFPESSGAKRTAVKWVTGLAKTAWKAEKVQPLLTSTLLNIAEIVAVRYGAKFFGQILGKMKKKKE